MGIYIDLSPQLQNEVRELALRERRRPCDQLVVLIERALGRANRRGDRVPAECRREKGRQSP